MTPTLILHLVSPDTLRDRARGVELFRLLCDTLPSITPSKTGSYEPLRMAFDRNDIESSLSLWETSVFWKTNKPRSGGSIWLAGLLSKEHSNITLRIEGFRALNQSDIAALADFWMHEATVDVGFVHLFTDCDIERGLRAGDFIFGDRRGRDCSVMWATHQLQSYLPNLYWRMTFGPPYIDLFTRERLLSAPAHAVRELDSGHITIQLTESYLDLETDYPHVAAVRDRVIEHLGPDAFFAEGRTEYRTPKFVFPR